VCELFVFVLFENRVVGERIGDFFNNFIAVVC